MTKAITVRLAEADHAALQQQSEKLGVRPGTLAGILLHAGLSGDGPSQHIADARAALDRLVRRSNKRPAADALSLVSEARKGLDLHE